MQRQKYVEFQIEIKRVCCDKSVLTPFILFNCLKKFIILQQQ
jgi:hypothetical protein